MEPPEELLINLADCPQIQPGNPVHTGRPSSDVHHNQGSPYPGTGQSFPAKLDDTLKPESTPLQVVEEEEEDVEVEQNTAHRDFNCSQKRRADYDAFDSWLAQNRNQISQANQAVAANLTDEDKTAAALVREFESAKIIESPRDYQIELFEKAKEKNIIAVLDTGSGKTLIAALLLQHTINKELENRAQQKPNCVSFFLVDKVALVFQQHAVLECNLDQPVAKFSGDKSDLRWSSKQFWDETLQQNMVIVCTADILLKCLHHSYVRMDQINLLIFDEAHHTKKSHSYARIIKDFYATETQTSKPKIFGMTASPVDARTNVSHAAQELEALLHSEICTVAYDSMLHSVSKPKKERTLHYHMVIRPPPTDLMEKLSRLVGAHKLFAKNFQFARDSLVTLGPWLVDRFWQRVFRLEELAKQEAKAEIDELLEDDSIGTVSNSSDSETASKISDDGGNTNIMDMPIDYSTNVTAVREASRLVQLHSFASPTTSQLSNKVQRLREALFDEYSKHDGAKTRCIVFVDQRYTALLLADLFQYDDMKIPNLRTEPLTGGGATDMGSNSFRTQLLTISKFKRGIVNCLFATSIAEEGLDIPDCNLIIRFDLYQTMIQYIQSRGRARHQESIYIHMVELGNLQHMRLLSENKASEDKMREFCNTLPEDRKLRGNDFNMDYFCREEKGQQIYEVPSTKAKLTYRSSLVILAQYVSTLPCPSDGALRAQFSVFHCPGGFVCEVTLPSSSPVRHATGRPHERKQIAKCAAAFAMCLRLYEKKYIDKHLKPIFASKLPVMRNARLAISSKRQEMYHMRSKPEAWNELGVPSSLYACILRLGNPDAISRPSRPIMLLTRQPMPCLAPFPLFFSKDQASLAECMPLDNPMSVTEKEANVLATYTLRIFDDVFSKEYEGTAADLPYFIVPCVEREHNFPVQFVDDARSFVDWDDVYSVSLLDKISCEGDEPDEFFHGKFIADPFDGSRKFYMRRVRRDMSPLDPVPDNVPAPKHRAWARATTDRNILNYSVSLWSKWRKQHIMRENQVVVEADIVAQRRNLLDDRMGDDEPTANICYLVMGTLRISTVPADVVAMVYNFPPIIHRLECALIALEATSRMGLHGIHPNLALEALTKDSDNSDDTSSAPINFQAGMGHNYERLELLGDSFLKMASTIALYTVTPNKDEFEYHVQRMCMICNRNLFNNALDLKLEEYIRSKEFGRSWYPQTIEVAGAEDKESPVAAPQAAENRPLGLVLKKGRRQKPASDHALGDKTIADVCEAIIGAAYLTTYQESNFDLAVKAVTAVVKSKTHPMKSYKEYFAAYTKPDWQTAPATAAQVHMDQAMAKNMGYRFRYPRLLRTAFMHPSYPRFYENLPDYQCLEFLGDALFDMAAVDFLFHRYPDKDPQWLTEHKMAMVSNQFLAALSVSLGFHKHLMSFSGPLQKQVLEYVAQIEDARTRAEDDAEQAGKPRSAFARDYWVHEMRPVKALADMLEAYIGAIFVDSEYDYHGVVVPFFQTHVQPYFEEMALYDTFAHKHPVTFAVNLLSQRFGCRDWRAVVQETPDTEGDGCVTFATQVAAGFLVHGRVIGHGLAESGRYAKIAAAKQALKKLDSLSINAFQAMTGCDCRVEAAKTEEVAEDKEKTANATKKDAEDTSTAI